MRVAAGLVLLALCIAAVAVLAHGNEPHPLSLVRIENIQIPTRATGISIKASPDTLKANGDWVDVEWSGVEHPKGTDFIAVYSPGGADVHKVAPQKWLKLSVVPGYESSGSGKWRFRILNIRADTSFVLYTGSFEHPVFGAQSNHVAWERPNAPTGVHLSLHTTRQHGANQSLNVVWNSGTRCANPRVQWADGPAGNGHEFSHESAANSTTTYDHSDMCGEPATSQGWLPQGVGYFHTAVLNELVPGAVYHYRVGDDTNTTEDGGWSEVFQLTAPLGVGPDQTFDVFAFGDLGQTQVDGSMNYHGSAFVHSRETTGRIADIFGKNPYSDGKGYAAVWHIGDLGVC